MKKSLILVLVLLIAATIFINGCQEKKIAFEFNSSVCGLSIGEINQSELGIKGIEWISKNKLEITALIRTNCAETVKNGDYEIDEDKITLYYQIEKCSTCATCLCPKYLTYKFINIPKKDYSFELKEI